MKRLFPFFFLLSVAFASCNPLSGLTPDIWEAIVILVYVDIFFLAVLYMVGKFFNNPYYLVFVKDELGHLLITAFLILFVQGIFVGTCKFLSLYSSQFGVGDQISYAQHFLTQLKREIFVDIKKLYGEFIENSIDSGFSLGRYDLSGSGVIVPVNAWKKTIAEHINLLLNILDTLYVSVSLQKTTFQLLMNDIIPILVPIGLFARFIPQLRETGNLILAVAFSFYIILPFTYSLIALGYQQLTIDYQLEDAFFGESLVAFAKYLPYAIFYPQLAFGVAIVTIPAIRKILSYGVVI